MSKARIAGCLMMLLALLGLPSWSKADEGAQTDSVMQINQGSDLAQVVEQMQSQMKQMQQTINSQNTEIQMLKKTQASEGQGAPVVTPAAPAFDLNTFQDMLGSSTDWIKGLKQGGDMRLRMENFTFYDKNSEFGATDRDRNRFRIRLRYGFEKDLGDDFKAGFRLVTGSASDPNSTNSTLGNPGYFNYRPVFFDLAYAKYKPHQLKDIGILKDVEIGGGKFSNPFLKYATTITWDSDVTPEGLFETINLKLLDTPENKIKSTINLGQLILNENSGVNADAELFAYQGGVTWTTDAFQSLIPTEKPISITGAMSLYQYLNYYRTVQSPAGVGTSLLRTNIPSQLGTASSDKSPQVLDFYNENKLDFLGRDAKLFTNFTTNVRNSNEHRAAANNNAYGIGLRYGRNAKPGDWELNWAYYYLGANATAAAFNDSDFGGPGYNGFTNRKGNKFGLTYRLTPSLEFNWTGYIVMPVNYQSAATSSTFEKTFRSQTDLVWKF